MIPISIVIAIIAVICSSYTTGNKQANDLMVKVGNEFDSIPRWENYSTPLGYLLFGIVPTGLLLFSFGWWGLVYIPIILITTLLTSSIFLKKQLQKRLIYAKEALAGAIGDSYEGRRAKIKEELTKAFVDNHDGRIREALTKAVHNKPEGKREEMQIEIEQHRVNVLLWLIAHPRSAQQIAVSDGKTLNTEISGVFEQQVLALDSVSKKERQNKKEPQHKELGNELDHLESLKGKDKAKYTEDYKKLYKKLADQGLLSYEKPKFWRPVMSKDKSFTNYFVDETGQMVHLSGGWLINESTGELNVFKTH